MMKMCPTKNNKEHLIRVGAVWSESRESRQKPYNLSNLDPTFAAHSAELLLFSLNIPKNQPKFYRQC